MTTKNLTLDCVLSSDSEGVQHISIDGCYSGQPNEIDPVVQLIREIPGSISDHWQWGAYWELQRNSDDDLREGRRSYWKSAFLPEITPSFIDTLCQYFQKVPSPHTILTFDHLHGAVNDPAFESSAFGHRGIKNLFLINTNWTSGKQDSKNILWTKDLFRDLHLQEHSKAYVNYLGFDENERERHSFLEPTTKKLQTIRAKYDPDRLFTKYH